MQQFLRIIRALGRVFPDCVMFSQAIAFNMFLAFFPMLLFALGLLTSTTSFHDAVREIPERLREVLPPGSEDVVMSYFVRKGVHPGRWMSLGFGGTLLAGTQVMAGFMEAFRVIDNDPVNPGFWHRTSRALVLLMVTIIPFLVVVTITVFGRQFRGWVIRQIGLAYLVREMGFLLYASLVFLLAMAVLVVIYKVGRPGHRGLRDLLPGAAFATGLWWISDISLGLYFRKMPYDVIYGGLAAAIGLLIWMDVTAFVVLWGAAYNSESLETKGSRF
jgi:membrane protein